MRFEIGVLVRCFYSGLVGGLPFVARVALLACIGGLAFVVCAFGGFLLFYCLIMHSSPPRLCVTHLFWSSCFVTMDREEGNEVNC